MVYVKSVMLIKKFARNGIISIVTSIIIVVDFPVVTIKNIYIGQKIQKMNKRNYLR